MASDTDKTHALEMAVDTAAEIIELLLQATPASFRLVFYNNFHGHR